MTRLMSTINRQGEEPIEVDDGNPYTTLPLALRDSM